MLTYVGPGYHFFQRLILSLVNQNYVYILCCGVQGYGYVGVSRFQSREGCHIFGKLRRTDFLPVGLDKEDEVLERGYDSLDSDNEEGCGLEYAFQGNEQDEEDDDVADPTENCGNELVDVDFQ